MSPTQLASVSAALRHLRDAEALLVPSPDQAWHVVGFAPECIRKACLRDRMFDKVLGHDWTPASEAMLEVAVSLDAPASRFQLSGWAATEPSLLAWAPGHRYDRTGKHAAGARELVAACGRLVRRVWADLWMDGALIDGAL